MFDCHVHSKFSSDGRMTPEEACEKAIEAGLSGIVFTDHLDLDYPGDVRFDNIDFKEYSDYLDRVKAKYSSRLKVLKGIEVGIQPHVIEESLNTVRSVDFDYVLASIHVIDGIDPYYGDYYIGKSIKEAYEPYLEKVLFIIRNFPDYDNIGHFDYIIRYAGYDDRTLRYNNHSDILDEIFKSLIAAGKGFEINTGSYREKPGIVTAEFDSALLKRYRELGGEIVSLASDAHTPDYIGYKFDYFKNMLKSCGFKHVAHFAKRKPVFTRL